MKRFLMSLLCTLGFNGHSHGAALNEEAFTERFVSALQAAAPEVTITVIGKLEVILKVEEGESRAFLDNAFAEYLRDPSLEVDVINRYVASCLESLVKVGPIKPENIVPVIKDRSWLAEIRSTASTVQGQVVEDFNEDLVIVYAEDSPRNTRYFSALELENIGVESKGLRPLALTNLRRIPPEIEQHPGPLVSMLTAGGDYVASLILLDEVWTGGSIQVDGDIVVAVPSRDVLLFTGSNNAAGIQLLRELAHKTVRDSSYGLTDRLFVRRNGKFERLSK